MYNINKRVFILEHLIKCIFICVRLIINNNNNNKVMQVLHHDKLRDIFIL